MIVFCSRYIDLLWNFASLYNWFMKVPPCTVPEKRESMPQSALSTPARCPACPPPPLGAASLLPVLKCAAA
eukprot:SAG25_NODE_6496_length_555_cov_0.592105_2_plen_70_part_01